MISFNNLGNLGRLANQMFQYASLRGIAAHRGYEFCIPPKQSFGINDSNVRNSDTTIYDCFCLGGFRQEIVINPIVQESGFDFDENIFNNCPDNVDLLGYFQSEKYFKHIETEIRRDFTFKEEIYSTSKEFFETLSVDDVISLHIRRGDYVQNPNHPVQTLEYYDEALGYFNSELPVLIFSDNPEWCKEQNLFESDRFLISETNSTNIDLCLMSMCKYHIIANSSFSWWGAWLAKSEKTVAPKNWFGGDCSKNNTKDLYLSNWIVL